MPSFANPFDGNVSKMMDPEELKQAIRLDLASELEAAFLYDSHIASTTDEVVISTLKDIRDEEIVHAGQLYSLLRHLDPEMDAKSQDGEDEFRQALQKLGVSDATLQGEVFKHVRRKEVKSMTRIDSLIKEAKAISEVKQANWRAIRTQLPQSGFIQGAHLDNLAKMMRISDPNQMINLPVFYDFLKRSYGNDTAGIDKMTKEFTKYFGKDSIQ